MAERMSPQASTPPSSERLLEEKLQLLVEASGVLLGSQPLEEVLPALLAIAQKACEAPACAIWRWDAADSEWGIVAAVGLSSQFRAVRVTQTAMQEIGSQPRCYGDIHESEAIAYRIPLYEGEGIGSFISIPLRIRGRHTGTFTVYHARPRSFSGAEIALVSALANIAASAIETAELYREQEHHRADAERGRARSALLAEAGTVLASSLDYEATLASVAQLAIKQLADWCMVEIVQDDGSLKTLAVAHIDPAKVEFAQLLRQRFPDRPDRPSPSRRVAQTGEPVLVSRITDPQLARYARSPEHLTLLRSLGFTSYMCVPIELRGRILGVISFVSANAGRQYQAEDLSFAESLARRSAMAIENSRLYRSVERERAAVTAALAALRENDERLRMALEAGRMGIWDWNIRTNDLEWSDSLAAMHGFEPGKFDNRFETYLSVIHPDDRPGFLASVDRALKEKSYFQAELRILFPDGSTHWIVGRGKVFCDETGAPARMIGLGLDVSDRHALEESLRNSQKLESVGLLAGGVAHDFNNLLTGILGNASLAMDLVPPRSPAVPLMESVMQASERAADLTRQLLAYSGKGRFVIEPVDLSELVKEIGNLLRTSIPKLVQLNLQLAPGLPAIEADSSQIQQVIMNLVINAAEAIGERPGTVTVRTGLQIIGEAGHASVKGLAGGIYVYLEVLDTGCGMDGETQARIFDPFFTTKFTGRGLGLAAVSGVVRGHRGAIRVHSAPGQGSIFRVFFPASEAHAGSAQNEKFPAADMRGSGLVLVIDDEETVRGVAESTLHQYGYDVAIARDGREGVEIFRRAPGGFRAVLLDLTMPVMGGEDTLRLLKEIRPDIPIIASSGYSELEASRRFREGALAGFLQKPYTGAALAAKLKQAPAPRTPPDR
ncbi:MAG TPA: GAF domain-containing protein [Bryobacteraceae bacterium]|nr:GAF domain-containing protein [Bryobacteraceae bacterium]